MTVDVQQLVFAGGHVFGHDGDVAVATAGGIIETVGPTDEVLSTLSRDAELVDLNGRMLTPGFQDAHIHPVTGGLIRMRCDLESAADATEAIQMIAAYAAANPEAEWIIGGGWKYRWFDGGNPTAASIDQITHRPIYLEVADGHSSWVNSAALRLAGVDRSTPDPLDGIIVRNPDGAPSGTLHEGAMDLVARVVPPDTPADLEQALLTSQDYLLGLGITAWQDAWVTPEIDAAYRSLDASGSLKVRVRGALWWERERGMEQLREIVERAAEPTDHYVPRTVKLMLDGVCENFTASMLEPFLDANGHTTENRGIDFIEPGALPEIVTRIDTAGLQCHFHALGDRAVRHALDAIEATIAANGPRDRRPHLAHLQIVDPEDIPRFAHLGAAANIQPLWAVAGTTMKKMTEPFLGPERSTHQYPFGSLHRTGARLAMGSDWSVSTPDVLQQVAVAVNRNSPGTGIQETFLPEQRLDVNTALASATEGAAYVNYFDHDSGRITPGARADLAVISGDPRSQAIHELAVDMTVLGGEVVHDTGR